MKVTVAEKFYCRRKGPESLIKESLDKCNLVMSTRNVNVPKIFKQAGVKAGASGSGASQTFLNFASLQDILTELGNIGPNKREHVLGPLSSLLFDEVTLDLLDDYLNGELYIPMGNTAIQRLTEIVKPSGIMSTSEKTGNYVPGLFNYTNETLISGDMPYGDFKLHLPTEKCLNLNKIKGALSSPITGTRLCLYMCIGPADEVLCGAAEENLSHRNKSTVTTLVGRRTGRGNEEVRDQPYTLLFYFANANMRERGVLEELSTRCLRYNKVDHLGPFYREVAVIRIGFLRSERAIVEIKEDVTTVRALRLAIGDWHKLTFKYGEEAGRLELKRGMEEQEEMRKRARLVKAEQEIPEGQGEEENEENADRDELVEDTHSRGAEQQAQPEAEAEAEPIVGVPRSPDRALSGRDGHTYSYSIPKVDDLGATRSRHKVSTASSSTSSKPRRGKKTKQVISSPNRRCLLDHGEEEEEEREEYV